MVIFPTFLPAFSLSSLIQSPIIPSCALSDSDPLGHLRDPFDDSYDIWAYLVHFFPEKKKNIALFFHT